MNRHISIIVIFMISIGIFQGCSLVKDLTSMRNVQFRIGSISSVNIGGVSVLNKRKVTDFSVSETMSLAGKVAQQSLPLSLTVNLEARNPNEAGENAISNNTIATLQSLEWRLLIDDVPTIEGVVKGPISLPAGGSTISIPIATEVELFSFFGERGYSGMAKLAFALANPGESTVSVKLDAKPMIQTFLGTMSYPGRITIIEKEFK
ncbi:MAG: hypothetical protein RIT37_1509 [Bacteroidota bacterium]